MQIPAILLEALASLEATAAAHLDKQVVDYQDVSAAYELAAMRWTQCIEKFLSENIDAAVETSSSAIITNSAAIRSEAYKHVFRLYNLARGYFFKAINENLIALSAENCEKFCLMEFNACALAREYNDPDIASKETAAKDRIKHIYKKFVDTNKDLANTLSFLLKSANYFANLAPEISEHIYKLIGENPKLLDDEYSFILREAAELEEMESEIYEVTTDLDIPLINKYIQSLNILHANLSFLMEIITLQIINPPKPKHNMLSKFWASTPTINPLLEQMQLKCKELEANLGLKIERASELQQRLFNLGYKMDGIESIDSPPQKTTLRNRFRY